MTQIHFFFFFLLYYNKFCQLIKLPSNSIRVHVDGVCALTVFIYIYVYICMYVQHDTLIS
jgi:hypothetical protein